MIIPETQAEVYDYPVMTFTYQVYRDNSANDQKNPALTEEALSKTGRNREKDFLGYIIFEFPEKQYNYIEQGADVLSLTELHETIEQIMRYRKSYGVWEV